MRSRYNTNTKLIKKQCEICGIKKRSVLHIHHIIPRVDPRCNETLGNLCVLCSNCHNEVHSGDITIIGVYISSDGRKLMWFRKGEQPPLEKKFWLVKENPFIITLNIKQ